MGTINAKQDDNALKSARKAINLKTHLDKVRDETDLDLKRQYAIEMAAAFEAGGREDFIKTIQSAKNVREIDQIAYNAALKGEGMGTKRFRAR